MAKFLIYKDSLGEYRWRLIAANGKIVADSGEGYSRREGALEDVKWVRTYTPGADLEEIVH